MVVHTIGWKFVFPLEIFSSIKRRMKNIVNIKLHTSWKQQLVSLIKIRDLFAAMINLTVRIRINGPNQSQVLIWKEKKKKRSSSTLVTSSFTRNAAASILLRAYRAEAIKIFPCLFHASTLLQTLNSNGIRRSNSLSLSFFLIVRLPSLESGCWNTIRRWTRFATIIFQLASKLCPIYCIFQALVS